MTGVSGRAVLFVAFSASCASLIAPAAAGCLGSDCIDITGLEQSSVISSGFDAFDRLHGGGRRDAARLQPSSPPSTNDDRWIDLRPHVLAYTQRTRWSTDAKTQSSGLSAGLAATIADGLVAGLSLSAGSRNAGIDGALTHDEARSTDHFALVHAQLAQPRSPLYLTLAVGHGWISSDMSRLSQALGRVAAQDVETTLLLGSMEAGYDWRPVAGFALTLFVRADAANLEQDGYDEVPLDGASLAPKLVPSASEQSLRSILGVRASVDIMSGSRQLRLTATTGWVRGFEPLPAVRGTDDSFLVQTGLESPVSDRTRIFVDYNALFASGIDSQGAEAGLRMAW